MTEERISIEALRAGPPVAPYSSERFVLVGVDRGTLLALVEAVEAAHAFVVDVDDAIADGPSRNSKSMRVGARFFKSHDRPIRGALARFDFGCDS